MTSYNDYGAPPPPPPPCTRNCGGGDEDRDDDTPDPNPNDVPAPVINPNLGDSGGNLPELSKDDDALSTPMPTVTPTPTTTTASSSEPDLGKIAWIAFGVTLIVVGVIALGGGIVFGAAAIGAIVEGGVAAELGMALYGLFVETQLLGWTGLATIWAGSKAIEKGNTP